MRIANNLMAMNAHRQLMVNQGGVAKSIEKLSSGLRINRAGDDAAGLAISEKMRGQIRGLRMAARNAQDAISLIQTTEGALNETHAILQRMRELAVQAANSTNTEQDRAEIQKEIDQLTSELNRIGNTTEFNTQKLLRGGKEIDTTTVSGTGYFSGGTTGTDAVAASVTIQDILITATTPGAAGNDLKIEFANGSGNNTQTTAAYDSNTSTVTVTLGTDGGGNVNATLQDVIDAINNLVAGDDVVTATYVGTSDPATESASATTGTQGLTGGADATHTTASQIITFTDVPVEGRILSVGDLKIGFWDSSSGNYSNEADAIQKLGVDSVIDLAGKNSADDVAAAVRSLALTGKNVTIDTNYTTTGQVKFEAATAGPEGNFIKSEFYSGTEDFQSTMQIGANTGQSFRVDIKDMRAMSLGVSTDHNGLPRTIVVDGKEYQVKWTQNKTVTNGTDAVGIEFSLDVSTHENATAAIGVIDEAINAVSTERSKLGAMQNRLEHTIANLNVSGENLQAAESRIRDVDMAAEMMTFTKYQILQQASTAMLAQANLAPQSVLQLLG